MQKKKGIVGFSPRSHFLTASSFVLFGSTFFALYLNRAINPRSNTSIHLDFVWVRFALLTHSTCDLVFVIKVRLFD
ncbi:hypothetical protein P8452_31720 [Trifolium repens]|nr:hypothetical protein P8452_31720 [Trifolium repens]